MNFVISDEDVGHSHSYHQPTGLISWNSMELYQFTPVRVWPVAPH